MRNYMSNEAFEAGKVAFVLGQDSKGKSNISCHMHSNGADVALVTPACITNWPRVNGDGDYGTMWGPTDPMRAKYTLDLTDSPVTDDSPNAQFKEFAMLIERVDDALLNFVCDNQLKILGRKNLSREEVKMLQIRSVRPKYDKLSGALTGHTLRLTTPKYAYDGMGGKYARTIAVCDYTGQVVENGSVCPGDIVAATIYVNQVYTGVGGDKFGVHWAFEDVQVVCQRAQTQQKTQVAAFNTQEYEFAKPYVTAAIPAPEELTQFSEPMVA